MIVWPNGNQVEHALKAWAEAEAPKRSEILRVGYYGSYSRGDWGVGSDLDVVVVVERCDHAFARRTQGWDTLFLPVPVDLFIYSAGEWASLLKREGRFSRMLRSEIKWVYGREA